LFWRNWAKFGENAEGQNKNPKKITYFLATVRIGCGVLRVARGGSRAKRRHAPTELDQSYADKETGVHLNQRGGSALVIRHNYV